MGFTEFLVFCSTFLLFAHSLLQGVYHALDVCAEWIVHFFPVKSAKIKLIMASVILLFFTACITKSMGTIDVPNIYRYLMRYRVVVVGEETVNFLYNIVTIFQIVSFLEVTAAFLSLCTRIYELTLLTDAQSYHQLNIAPPGRGMSKRTPEFEKLLKRMYPFSFAEQCNPDGMLLTSKKSEGLFPPDKKNGDDKEDADDVHED
ncbi:MAG: hypothetical protein E7476_11325 [Ruminococcaceae bacterium]|nr:hypothetical protein [Oscillospiraceae bacterium]